MGRSGGILSYDGWPIRKSMTIGISELIAIFVASTWTYFYQMGRQM